MLNKLFNVRKLRPLARGVPAKVEPGAPGLATPASSSSTVLKIVHVGGYVECYYMATPAVIIIEKYPSFILARPEVFRRPWDSVVRPDEILTPGEKFLVVPRLTIKKLRQRVRKPDRDVSVNSFASKSSIDVSFDMVSSKKEDLSFQQNEDSISAEVSSCSSFKSAFRRKSAIRKQVRFAGIEVKHTANEKKNKTQLVQKKPDKPENSFNSQSPAGKKRGAKIASAAWQPSLTAITEKTDE